VARGATFARFDGEPASVDVVGRDGDEGAVEPDVGAASLEGASEEGTSVEGASVEGASVAGASLDGAEVEVSAGDDGALLLGVSTGSLEGVSVAVAVAGAVGSACASGATAKTAEMPAAPAPTRRRLMTRGGAGRR
jgi:uncharacterized protein YjbI with pentapeptide repeats